MTRRIVLVDYRLWLLFPPHGVCFGYVGTLALRILVSLHPGLLLTETLLSLMTFHPRHPVRPNPSSVTVVYNFSKVFCRNSDIPDLHRAARLGL
jgi:hypothetical protein